MLTGTVLFGEIATTTAGSVAAAAVEAAFTAALLVPSVIFVLWVPPMIEVSSANPVMAAGGVSVVIVAAGRMTGTEPAASAWPRAGVLVSIEATEVLPVVWAAKVAVNLLRIDGHL